MKLVLSRKGFDSSYGGIASPILPDGRLIPLPIPSRHDKDTIGDLHYADTEVEKLLSDLSKGRYSLSSTVHHDPQLALTNEKKPNGWRPVLGQTGAAQSHLSKEGIGIGDVFLFFGWFRLAELYGGTWRFVPTSPNLHLLFGWLEIGEILPVVSQRDRCLADYPWISEHPHVATPLHYTDARNHLYIAKEQSQFLDRKSPGGGYFPKYSSSLQLTLPGSTRTVWSLPHWFLPEPHQKPLSYHADPSRWRMQGERAILKSAAKGQEFVLDCQHYDLAEEWITKIIKENVLA